MASKRAFLEKRAVELGYETLKECLNDLYNNQKLTLHWLAYHLQVNTSCIRDVMDDLGLPRRSCHWNLNKRQLRGLFIP